MRKNKYTNFDKLKRKNKTLTYANLLTTTEWREKRKKVVNRDESKCTHCGKKEHIVDEFDGYRDMTELERSEFLKKANQESLNSESGKRWLKLFGTLPKFLAPMVKKENYIEPSSVILHVHHKYYIRGKNPWEYNNNALITVCSECHNDIHDSEKMIIYENENLDNPKIIEKCKKCNGTGYLSQFDYYLSGICFACDGKGTSE